MHYKWTTGAYTLAHKSPFLEDRTYPIFQTEDIGMGKGSCLCGKVTFEFTGEVEKTVCVVRGAADKLATNVIDSGALPLLQLQKDNRLGVFN